MKAGVIYELPRPTFKEWLFRIKPTVEFIIDDPTVEKGDACVKVDCQLRGASLVPSYCWPSHLWHQLNT